MFVIFQRSGELHRRLDETRVNADDIIDQLLNGYVKVEKELLFEFLLMVKINDQLKDLK